MQAGVEEGIGRQDRRPHPVRNRRLVMARGLATMAAISTALAIVAKAIPA